MSSRDLAPLTLDVPLAAGRIALLAVGALGVVVAASLLPPAQSLLVTVALLFIGCWEGWRQGLWGRRYRVRQLLCSAFGEWSLVTAEGARMAAVPLGVSRIGAVCLWLGWQCERRRYWMLLVKGQIPAGPWRQLQARMRLWAPLSRPPAADSQGIR